ncbi:MULTISPECIES: hypothetical protein [Sandaracinus]|uniref:hypothetical protein n=1 Tax=Sandaracinus TaxID=1055688 RepID=UPI0019D44A64|nr:MULTISPECIES: hypothetical protein [Sandaracinus]QRN75781.1 Hypothetical protein MSR10575_88680 [Sandaracinus sp.]UJR87298.1 Hypothetical protein I5071_900 [Sandaracinus amylolyticus]
MITLSGKKARFVALYLGKAQGDAIDAARMAGYESPERQGPLLLRCADVCEGLEQARNPPTPAPSEASSPQRAAPPRALRPAGLTPARLDVTLKLSELPRGVMTRAKDGWKEFRVDCDGRAVSIAMRPRVWNKLEQAAKELPDWVASITGKMGPPTREGFVLLEPGVQVFERKSKAPDPEVSTAPNSATNERADSRTEPAT